jgi:hypothetical protein
MKGFLELLTSHLLLYEILLLPPAHFISFLSSPIMDIDFMAD